MVTSAVDHTWHSLAGSAIAGAVAFVLFFAVWWFVPRGMGFGDVRLSGVIGLTVGYLSLLHAYVAFLAGFVIGLLFGLALMVVPRGRPQDRIPVRAVAGRRGGRWPSSGAGTVAQHLFHAGGCTGCRGRRPDAGPE